MAKLPESARRRKAYRPAIIARQQWVKNTSGDVSDWKIDTIDKDNGHSDVTITFSTLTDDLRDYLLALECRHIVRWKEKAKDVR